MKNNPPPFFLSSDVVNDPEIIEEWLDVLNFTMAETSHYAALASWNYVTNITKYNTEVRVSSHFNHEYKEN